MWENCFKTTLASLLVRWSWVITERYITYLETQCPFLWQMCNGCLVRYNQQTWTNSTGTDVKYNIVYWSGKCGQELYKIRRGSQQGEKLPMKLKIDNEESKLSLAFMNTVIAHSWTWNNTKNEQNTEDHPKVAVQRFGKKSITGWSGWYHDTSSIVANSCFDEDVLQHLSFLTTSRGGCSTVRLVRTWK